MGWFGFTLTQALLTSLTLGALKRFGVIKVKSSRIRSRRVRKCFDSAVGVGEQVVIAGEKIIMGSILKARLCHTKQPKAPPPGNEIVSESLHATHISSNSSQIIASQTAISTSTASSSVTYSHSVQQGATKSTSRAISKSSVTFQGVMRARW